MRSTDRPHRSGRRRPLSCVGGLRRCRRRTPTRSSPLALPDSVAGGPIIFDASGCHPRCDLENVQNGQTGRQAWARFRFRRSRRRRSTRSSRPRACGCAACRSPLAHRDNGGSNWAASRARRGRARYGGSGDVRLRCRRASRTGTVRAIRKASQTRPSRPSRLLAVRLQQRPASYRRRSCPFRHLTRVYVVALEGVEGATLS